MHARSLAFVATLLFASQAGATPRNTAKAHIDKAMKAHKEGKFDVALDELKAAYALDPKPDLLFAIAQVYVKLDNCTDAITYYEKFLATSKDAQAKPVVTQAVDACKAKLAAVEPPKDPIKEPPKDPVKEPPKDPVKEPKDPEPPKDPVITEPKKDDPFASGRSDKSTRSPFYKDALGDVFVFGGVAAGVIAIVEYAGARSDNDAAGDPTKTKTLSDFNSKNDDASTKRTLSVVFGVGGAALLTVGVVHWKKHGNKETSRVGMVPMHDGGFVTWLGRF